MTVRCLLVATLLFQVSEGSLVSKHDHNAAAAASTSRRAQPPLVRSDRQAEPSMNTANIEVAAKVPLPQDIGSPIHVKKQQLTAGSRRRKEYHDTTYDEDCKNCPSVWNPFANVTLPKFSNPFPNTTDPFDNLWSNRSYWDPDGGVNASTAYCVQKEDYISELLGGIIPVRQKWKYCRIYKGHQCQSPHYMIPRNSSIVSGNVLDHDRGEQLEHNLTDEVFKENLFASVDECAKRTNQMGAHFFTFGTNRTKKGRCFREFPAVDAHECFNSRNASYECCPEEYLKDDVDYWIIVRENGSTRSHGFLSLCLAVVLGLFMLV